MKGMKKLLSVLMVLTLVLSLGATALADRGIPMEGEGDSVKVTLPKEYATHTMKAYQIFTGAQQEGEPKEQNKLGVTGWGNGVNPTGLLTALGLPTNTSAAAAAKHIQEAYSSNAYDFAKLVNQYLNEAKAVTFSGDPQPTATLGSGYWIIVDKTVGMENEENFAYSAYLLQVVGTEGEIPMTPKMGVPTVVKEVADQNDSTGDEETWGTVADWDIGDNVPFKLEATMPGSLVGYTSYKLVFHDTLSSGLTLNESSVKVFVGDQDITNVEGCTVVIGSDDDNTTITITIENVLDEKIGAGIDGTITVTYDAKLDEDAVIGGIGNPNEVYLEYSNDPNGTGTGKTPTQKVVVFTFQLNVNKVKPAPTEEKPDATEPLDGAGFTLYKYDADAEGEDNWVQIGDPVDVDGNDEDGYTASFKGLDKGKYKLVESTVPEGYNKADDIEFEVTAVETVDGVQELSIKGENAASFKTDRTTGVISTDVVNSTGLELPETGGIGTTIFYVAGAVLVAAAVILLVTKKRVNGAEK